MTDSNEKQLEVGGDFLESLAAANLANWQAINEMTANSIDAWFDMNSKTHQLVIDIPYHIHGYNNLLEMKKKTHSNHLNAS